MEKFNSINQLLSEVQTISESYDRVAEATGENFNIFSILRMESDEVATHSRFIAELLNRNGSHGLKDKFLCLFIERFVKNEEFVSEFVSGRSHVIVEYYIGKIKDETGGRIDILIKDDGGNVIMIENKIYAGEQYKQLSRYGNAFSNGELFYLTLFGGESADESSNAQYKPLSYETDIIEWLEACKKESVSIPIVRESISQYIYLLKKLTHQNANKKMSEDIINRVLRDSDSLKSYKVLFDACKELKKKLVGKILAEMKSKLEDSFFNIEIMDFSKDKELFISFQNPTLQRMNLSFRLNFERSSYSKLIIGFYDKLGVIDSEDDRLFEAFKQEFGRAKSSKNYPAYIIYDEFENWHLDILSQIYFDFDLFYTDFKGKVDLMLDIVETLPQEPVIMPEK